MSTAMQPNSSSGPSMSRAWAVPMFARSIFTFPPGTETAMLPDRSSTTTMATANLRCSWRNSIETGMTGSRGDL